MNLSLSEGSDSQSKGNGSTVNNNDEDNDLKRNIYITSYISMNPPPLPLKKAPFIYNLGNVAYRI